MTILLVMLAGGAGAVARFVLGGLISSRFRSELPSGTILVNISGSLLMGLLAGAVIFHGAPAALQTVLGTGFLGGTPRSARRAWTLSASCKPAGRSLR